MAQLDVYVIVLTVITCHMYIHLLIICKFMIKLIIAIIYDKISNFNLKESELIEPLMPAIRACLEHRHSYVRRNAVFAIYTIYR